MKISFHGAARTVTGSKHLITLKNQKKILLDCGLFQGKGSEAGRLNAEWGFEPESVDYVFLSHAHIDHSGLLPKLVKDGFKGKIYCTPATAELATILLEDSAGIQEDETKYINKKRRVEGRPLLDPLYTMDDAVKVFGQFKKIEYGGWHKVDNDIEVLFTDTGHIIGSAAVHVKITEDGKTEQVSFSGDVGRYRDVILKSPQIFPQADYIILESTYGNSLHDLHVTTPDHLLEIIEETCVKNKGKLIMPAFSVGRTQELLFALNQLELEKRLPNVDYYVDSPLSVETTELLKKYPEYFNKNMQKLLKVDGDPFKFKGLKYIQTVEESKLLNFRQEPCVIISASGMADAGRVKHHIRNNIENSKNAILMTGYCEPNSLGGRLMNGAKEVSIFGQRHEVHAAIKSIRSMSAHGDFEDLSQFLACQDPKLVKQLFLVHGEYEVQEAFKDRLMKKGFEVSIPEMHQVFGLS
jgi:metallo-beta-lactamase family protein